MASTFFSWFRSPAAREYFFSTHFWGPVANFGLPLAAISDLNKDEELISGTMTATLACYSFYAFWFAFCLLLPGRSTLIFIAAWRVQPRNYLLLVCHTTNSIAQSTQGARFINYWYYGGRERKYGLSEAEPKSSVTGELHKSDAK